jgi:hypothetical protein
MVFVLIAGAARADENRNGKEPPVRQLLVIKNRIYRLQATSKKPLRSVRDEIGKPILSWKVKKGSDEVQFEQAPGVNDKYVRVVPGPNGDRTTVGLHGESPGTVRITLVDEAGAKEDWDIEVRNEVFVPLGKSEAVQMATRKAIKEIANESEKVIAIEKMPGEAGAVKVTGRASGDARFTLTGDDGRTETVEVVVRSEKEPGKNLLLLTADCGLRFQTPGKKPIRTAINSSEEVVRMRPLSGPDTALQDPTSLIIEALKPGFCRLEIEELEGVTEKYEVIVRADGPIPKDHVVLTVGKPHRVERPMKEGAFCLLDVDEENITVSADEKDDAVLVIDPKTAGSYCLLLQEADTKIKLVFLVVRKKPAEEK